MTALDAENSRIARVANCASAVKGTEKMQCCTVFVKGNPAFYFMLIGYNRQKDGVQNPAKNAFD